MSPWVDRCLDRLGGFLLPPRCVLCGEPGQPPCLDLCRACEADLPRAVQPVADGPWPLGRCHAPFDYAHPVDHLVHALKYRGQLAIGRVLGTLLGRRIAAGGLGVEVDVVLPVPLHPRRHGDAGYNQSAEIARWVARDLRRPLRPRLALRRRDTRPQVGLDPARRRDNLAGAFAASREVRGLRIALVDDVTTTGRTIAELGQVLLDAGAGAVEAWCVCRAQPPDRVDLGRDPEAPQT